MTRGFRGNSDNDPPTPAERGGKVNSGGGLQDKISAMSKYHEDDDLAAPPQKTEFGNRFVAFMIDVVAGYLFGLVLNMIPFVNIFVSAYTTIVIFLLVRDGLFDGRGIGKNLMGLQVVDMKSGEGIGVVQSIRRNIVLFGPSLVYFICNGVLKFIPVAEITGPLTNIVSFVCGIYTLVVLPYEAYRLSTREDGMRLGDAIAGTTIIEAPMDFSTPIKP